MGRWAQAQRSGGQAFVASPGTPTPELGFSDPNNIAVYFNVSGEADYGQAEVETLNVSWIPWGTLDTDNWAGVLLYGPNYGNGDLFRVRERLSLGGVMGPWTDWVQFEASGL